jgi:hypothetical protein
MTISVNYRESLIYDVHEDYLKATGKQAWAFDVNHKNPSPLWENGGKCTYAMSPINSQDKYSLGYFYCVWLVASWRLSGREENISFLTHQDTIKFQMWELWKFSSDIEKSIVEILSLVEEESLEIWLFWGSAFDRENFRMYWNFLIQLHSFVREVSWKTLKTLIWPSKSQRYNSPSHFYFHNDSQTLDAIYPKQRWGHVPWNFKSSEIFDVIDM